MNRRTFAAIGVAVLVSGMLAACGGEGEGGGLNEQPLPTSKAPAATVASPEDLNQKSLESGYSLKATALEDPATAAAGYEVKPDTRLIAVQVELANESSDDAMSVDMANAVVTDDKGIDYVAVAGGKDGEIKATDLKKGERANGWIAFQVPKDAKLKSLTYRIGLLTTIALTADLPQK